MFIKEYKIERYERIERSIKLNYYYKKGVLYRGKNFYNSTSFLV